jgi:hypothetical protein
MFKVQFGRPKVMVFANANEYYLTLGFLAKSDGTTSIVWENNQYQGAWKHEVRIHCLKDLNTFTPPLINKFTRGRTGILKRINCNEFIEDLLNNHGFVQGAIQNITTIRSTIPAAYVADFDSGLLL